MLQMEGSAHALEIRLRCDWEEACGMAAVTRLIEPPTDQKRQQQQPWLDPSRIQRFRELCFPSCEKEKDISIRAHHDPSYAMLYLALQSPETDEYSYPSWNNDSTVNNDTVAVVNDNLTALVLTWLGTAYSSDRRELKMKHHQGANKRQRQLWQQWEQQELLQSQNLLKERILQACRLCKSHPREGPPLLRWLLQESPTIAERSTGENVSHEPDWEIEKALLSLSHSVLKNDESSSLLVDAVEWNWACRGRPLAALMQWHLGKISTAQIIMDYSIVEWIEMVSMNTKNR
jgi:hypothetical protein